MPYASRRPTKTKKLIRSYLNLRNFRKRHADAQKAHSKFPSSSQIKACIRRIRHSTQTDSGESSDSTESFLKSDDVESHDGTSLEFRGHLPRIASLPSLMDIDEDLDSLPPLMDIDDDSDSMFGDDEDSESESESDSEEDGMDSHRDVRPRTLKQQI